jgi:ABC-type branched-subunit amino acid transport system substrate-binding protein
MRRVFSFAVRCFVSRILSIDEEFMMRKQRALVLALTAAVLVAVVAACGGSSDSAKSNATTNSAGSASGTPSFHLEIGTILPFTGDLSAVGPSIDASARLAADTINAALQKDGLAQKISVKIVDSQDDQTSTQPAIEAATKEVKVDKVSVIVGTMSSQSTIAVAQAVTIPAGTIMITPTGSAPQITGLKDNNTVWRILPSDLFQGKAMASAVESAFGKTASINVAARNDAFGSALKQLFIKTWKAGGGKVGTDVSWDPNQASFDSEAQKLVSGSPKGWVIIDFPETFAKVGPALIRTGKWDPSRTFMTDVMSIPASLKQVGKQATLGLRGVAPTAPSASVKQTGTFATLFTTKKKGKPVTGYEGTSFDSVMVAFLAALKGHSAQPNAIKANLRSISGPPGTKITYLDLPKAIKLILAGKDVNYEGVFGPIDYDANGDVGASIFKLWRYDGKTVSTVKTFVYG